MAAISKLHAQFTLSRLYQRIGTRIFFYSVPNAKKARKKINFLIILPIPMKKALKRLKYWCFADRIQIEFMLAIELDTDKFERVNGSVKTNKTRLESGLQKMFKNIVDSSCRL